MMTMVPLSSASCIRADQAVTAEDFRQETLARAADGQDDARVEVGQPRTYCYLMESSDGGKTLKSLTHVVCAVMM